MFKVNDTVRIKKGMYKHFKATVTSISSAGNIRVSPRGEGGIYLYAPHELEPWVEPEPKKPKMTVELAIELSRIDAAIEQITTSDQREETAHILAYGVLIERYKEIMDMFK